MDSIGDNVIAIICVVVGILIIGCALVPIVDKASIVETETIVTDEVTGYNTAVSENSGWYSTVSAVSISTDGTTVMVNDEAFTESYNIVIGSGLGSTKLLLTASNSTKRMAVSPHLDPSLTSDAVLSSGTMTYDGSTLAVTGTTTNSEPYSYSADFSKIYARIPTEFFTTEETEWYGIASSPIVIGEEQMCVSGSGSTTITTETTSLPNGVSMVSNDNHTSTITFSGDWYGPKQWEGYTTTTETVTSESEYARLYNIIPVLCILGMAYVLIRRFY